jgi:SAM-dependent methyltransferase
MAVESIVERSDGGAGTGPGDGDVLRSRLRGMWGGVAAAWEEHAADIDARGAELTARLLELAALRPGDRVLELACGPGGLGIAAASLVAPGGEVVVSDVASAMTAAAARRAEGLGLANVRARDLDLEEIAEPDAAYDVVLCREGLMLVPDPDRAAREIARVLRPGGRIAVSVWGPRARNPWLGAALDALAQELGRPAPPPGVPGPFSLEDAGRLEAVLAGAGLAGAAVEELSVPLRAPSFDAWWTRTCALAGPLAAVVASLPAEAAASLRERARRAAEPYATAGGGLDFPGVTLIASAVRP